jgi:hypothetical protein
MVSGWRLAHRGPVIDALDVLRRAVARGRHRAPFQPAFGPSLRPSSPGEEPHRIGHAQFDDLAADQHVDEAADWLHAAAYNLRFAYKLKGKIKVEITVERQAEEEPTLRQ